MTFSNQLINKELVAMLKAKHRWYYILIMVMWLYQCSTGVSEDITIKTALKGISICDWILGMNDSKWPQMILQVTRDWLPLDLMTTQALLDIRQAWKRCLSKTFGNTIHTGTVSLLLYVHQVMVKIIIVHCTKPLFSTYMCAVSTIFISLLLAPEHPWRRLMIICTIYQYIY